MILVAPNTFKGSLSAREAAEAIASGLRRVDPEVALRLLPLSDGGEGLVETLVAGTGGQLATMLATDALGRPIVASYGRLGDGETVAVELSSAAGLVQIPADQRNPLITTTRGVGELIAAAWAEAPFKKLLLTLGGSATVDGGVGLLQALGVRFRDVHGDELPPGGAALRALAKIDPTGAHPVLREAAIRVAVDVTNPLVGERGAARVYGPQKGAEPEAVERLEAALTRLADVLAETTGMRVHDQPGAGAAGGVSAPLVALFGAERIPGFDLAAEAVHLDEALSEADWAITGEGRLDDQSFEGKVVGGLAERARRHGVGVVAIAGMLTEVGENRLAELGGAAFPLVEGPIEEAMAMHQAAALLERAAARLLRVRRQGRDHLWPTIP
jgi:glycerate kinase